MLSRELPRKSRRLPGNSQANALTTNRGASKKSGLTDTSPNGYHHDKAVHVLPGTIRDLAISIGFRATHDNDIMVAGILEEAALCLQLSCLKPATNRNGSHVNCLLKTQQTYPQDLFEFHLGAPPEPASSQFQRQT